MRRKAVNIFLLVILTLIFLGVTDVQSKAGFQKVGEILAAAKKTNNVALFMLERRVQAKVAASNWDESKECWRVILGKLKSLKDLANNANISCNSESDVYFVSSIDEAVDLIKNYLNLSEDAKSQ